MTIYELERKARGINACSECAKAAAHDLREHCRLHFFTAVRELRHQLVEHPERALAELIAHLEHVS